jgi:hypothetical protein
MFTAVTVDTWSLLIRIVLVGAVLAAALALVQQQRVLENAGLLGYCSTIATPKGQTGHWHACQPGKLTARPSSRFSPAPAQAPTGKVEYWRCPTELQRNRARQ